MDIDDKRVDLQPHRRPRRRSAWKCLGIACGLLTLGIIIFITFAIVSTFYNFTKSVRDPHRSLIYNGTLTSVKPGGGQVVGPLIDMNTEFDVVFTVWRRVPNNETEYADEYLRAGHDDGLDEIDAYNATELAVAGMTQLAPVEIRRFPQQELLWSGVVFKDVTMRDKHLDAEIQFKLPLSRFYDERLYSADVRGAMAMVPKKGSKLDRMESHSDWRPERVKLVPKMDESLKETVARFDDNQWDAIEHMAVSWSLIEFHNRPNPCDKINSTTTLADSEVQIKEEKLASEESIDFGFETEEQVTSEEMTGKKTKKIGDINKELHPHIITRSHLYIMNETRLFDRKAFDKQHKTLRDKACGGNFKGDMVSRYLCHRSYDANGHWENRFLLREEGGGAGKELAYGPYMASLNNAAGPRDVHPLPVTRFANCTLNTTDPEYIDVVYNLRLSALSPGRVHLLDTYLSGMRAPHNATEADKADLHNNWEVQSGLFGDKAEGSHPWRRFIISGIRDIVLGIPVNLLTLLYWYTRTTTVGINHNATILAASATVADNIRETIVGFHTVSEWAFRLLAIIFTVWDLAPAVLQLRLVFPFDIKWTGWGMRVTRWQWSHRERASQRKGTQVAPRVWLLCFAALFSILYFPARGEIWLVNPHVAPNPPKVEHRIFDSILLRSVIDALGLQGLIMQLEHNRQAGTFAGSYALTAHLTVAQRVLQLLYYSSTVIGKFDVREGIRFATALSIGLESWRAWQAWTVPRVEQDVTDEAEEE
ncbi:hypothetical protein IAR55_004471 [Kwoniella newhampshirensis]|uniref:Uncharacterized protein n=1 Tax=Kwoniella newhampshirensis TaxID=1651941 RepID=A0AAW0YL01_9TREE